MCVAVWRCGLGAVYAPSGGPVYVNPDAAAAKSAAIQQNEAVELVTQTVYGFLDFTTTIGNTVMIFSPQSAVSDGGKKSTSSVIETKPSTQSSSSVSKTEIKPSKTVVKSTDKKVATVGNDSEKNKIHSSADVKPGPPTILSSVVEVRGGGSPSSIVKVKPGLSSVVEVRGGASSSILSSKVEVHEGTVTLSRVIKEPSSKVDVFSGASSVVEVRAGPSKILSSHVEIHGGNSVKVEDSHQNELPAILSSVVEVKTSSEEPALSGNNIVEPEYDFLSRQPSEIVDETYRVINLRPSSKFHLKARSSSKVNIVSSHGGAKPSRGGADHIHPTGLVTTLGGTVVKEGVTTVHETSVIGTFISGKYAQVLQSTSHIFHSHQKPKPTPSSTQRILKTTAPSLSKQKGSAHLEPTPAGSLYDETVALPLEALFSSAPSSNFIRSSRRPSVPKNSLHSKFHRGKGRDHHDNREQDLGEYIDDVEDDDLYVVPTTRRATSRGGNVRPTQTVRSSSKSSSKNAFSNNRFGRVSSTPELATVSVFSDTSSVTPSGGRRFHQQSSQRRGGSYRTSSTVASSNDGNSFTRRGYKPRVQPSSADNSASSTSLYKFKLARPPGRWQYKTTPKPRVNIRKQAEDDLPFDNITLTSTSTTQQPHPQYNPEIRSRSDDTDQELTGSETGVASVNEEDPEEATPVGETLKVEISTPADFRDTYYEIATIRSPYTFQVGTVTNTRFITVTSTIEKTFENTDSSTIASSSVEPLTENILATSSHHYDKDNIPLDSSIATLPPIGLAGDAETPPLETLTETFSTTQLLLKTHILPVIRGGSNTTHYTLVQSYHVTRLVTATKTLPPMDVYHFVPSKTLNEFNTRLEEAGSELHLELEFGDENNQDDDDQPAALRALQPDIDLANIESHQRLKKAHSSPPKPTNAPEPPPTPALSPEQVQQLALLRLLNPAAAAAIPQVITTSKPVLKVETVYESHVLPVINGATTIYSTISRPVATVSKTEYEYGTSTLPALPIPPVNPLNPLFPQQQQQFQITSTPVVTQTVVTETNSKVLKLTFGAKTAYTTLLSTKVVPTLLTTYVTQSIPVQPTAPAFPGYFPAPYAQFPFLSTNYHKLNQTFTHGLIKQRNVNFFVIKEPKKQYESRYCTRTTDNVCNASHFMTRFSEQSSVTDSL
ncbi:hypothetical protein L9F63_003693, partial [Diploptera punctata]